MEMGWVCSPGGGTGSVSLERAQCTSFVDCFLGLFYVISWASFWGCEDRPKR